MAKPLSDQLADLSTHAKNAEVAAAAARKEAQDKITVRINEAHASATAAVDKAKQSLKTVEATGARKWDAAKAKVAADVDDLKAHVATKKRALDAKVAEDEAENAETDASFAIDYAVATVEQAKLAVLNAISVRLDAEALRVKVG